MKKQVGTFIAGFVTASVFMGTTIFADSATKMIEVMFNSINVKVNGKVVEAENILYEGRTYVPLRAVSEMLGKHVNWDGNTNTASINDEQSTMLDESQELATINGESVSLSDYKFHFLVQKQEMEYASGSQNPGEVWENLIDGKDPLEVLKQKSLDNVVIENTLLKKAKEMNITLSEEEQKNLSEDKAGFIASRGGQEEYEKLIASVGLTDEGYDKFKVNQMLLSKLNQTISDELGTTITEDVVKADYEKNKEDYKKEQVKAKHILLKTTDESGAELTGDKLEEVKKKAEDILKRAKDGEDFAKLMSEYSEDPGSKAQPEGYTFGKGEMVPEFETAAFSMKVGDISELVKTQFGYHIIKVEGKFDYTPYEDAKESIKGKMVSDKFNEKVEQWKKEATVNINNEVMGTIDLFWK